MKKPVYSSFKGKRIVYAILFLLLFFCSCDNKRHNRLINASSPYLKEHADNPVDWYEWGEEALREAKTENKPLLISVGYSSCYWCHKMEKESFMDTAVARLMNENFVCIKVDREERPDIDNVYSHACQLISGSSGWPLNAFALPDGRPFFAGTYYSKNSWIHLLKQISSAYKTQKNKVELQAHSLSKGVANLEFSVLTDNLNKIDDKKNYQGFFESLYREMDPDFGGLKGSPKFPIPTSLNFFLHYYSLTKDKRALEAASTTLTKMALGGIYDQVGGGFSRYAVDSLWRVPHFEKMLYDNAQLLSVYAYAYSLTGNDFFKRIVQEIIAFSKRDLSDPIGGYYSSVNATTNVGEGEYYIWSSAELKSKLQNNYDLFAKYYNVSEDGNWKENKNILYASENPSSFAQKNNLNANQFLHKLASIKQVLLNERNKRNKPSADEKILTSWNALLLQGYLDAFSAIGDKTYLQNALSIARFLEAHMIRRDGGLFRNFKDGRTSVNGFLDDYALVSRAFVQLYERTTDDHWLTIAKKIADYAINKFYDPSSEMFFYTEHGSDKSIIRKIEITDNNVPSSNAAMAEVLYRLGNYFNNKEYPAKSKKMVSKIYDQLQKKGTSHYASWCYLVGLMSYQ